VTIRNTAIALLLSVALLLLLLGCDGATGSIQGGQSLSSDTGSTWTDLYADYFGPGGSGSCSGQSYCHDTAAATGAMTSGFVCGPTQESCWEGMVFGIPADAGGGIFPPLASSEGAQLFSALHKTTSSGQDLDNMPCGAAPQGAEPPLCLSTNAAYAFTPADLARITSWIQQGAQDN
jgi:hypothetical protein